MKEFAPIGLRLHLPLRNFRFLAFVTALDKEFSTLALEELDFERQSERRRHQVGAAITLAANQGAELIRRCRAGDGAAWEEIVQSYSRRIYNLAYRFTSRADAAEDLTQEVFVRVYRSLGQYDSKQGDLQNWLMRLARNLIIDDYRKRQRTPHDNHADDLADHSYHLPTPSRSVQQEIERRELGSQVQAGIDKLSPDLRTCVILRDIEELTYQEIVDLLRIPEGTVKSRINRGRIELAKILRRMKVVAMSQN
ncbi:MAG: sigma-70 family RNA polymerase sigma factor [Acidobacteriota bacterium]|nr:sigma-70 family RNA polymerase sigma factor [Acidobacteriota bacterium]